MSSTNTNNSDCIIPIKVIGRTLYVISNSDSEEKAQMKVDGTANVGKALLGRKNCLGNVF